MTRSGRWILGGALAGVVLALLVGALVIMTGAPGPGPAAAGPSTAETADSPRGDPGFVVVTVVDGDTVRVRPAGGGAEQRVRLIGIDAPETGSCEAQAATEALQGLVLGRAVTLVPGGDGEDLDRHGRALRYVDTGDGDAGLALVAGGYAIARYDSRDGYGRHDREEAYLAADAGSPAYACAIGPGPTASTSPAPASTGTTGPDPPAPDQPPPDGRYPDCRAAWAAGAAPITTGRPGYSVDMDGDRDGVACERRPGS